MQQLAPIPADVQIVEKDGTINDFFRFRWQELIDASVQSPLITDALELLNQSAAVPTTTVYTVTADGLYRVGYYLRKTILDGVSSSLQVTLSWTDTDGAACSHTFAALTTDTNVANDSASYELRAKANSDIEVSIAYASNTPGTMHFDALMSAQQLV